MSTTAPVQATRIPQRGGVFRRKASPHPLLAIACVGVLAVGERSIAEGASDEDCRKFHQECVDARAQGYRDVGICNVERLECENGRGSGSTQREREEAPTYAAPPDGYEARSAR